MTTAALPAFVAAAPLCRADYCGNRASVASADGLCETCHDHPLNDALAETGFLCHRCKLTPVRAYHSVCHRCRQRKAGQLEMSV